MLGLWQLTQGHCHICCKNLLSGVSNEGGLSQSTDGACLSGSSMLLTAHCLLFTMAACGAHSVCCSSKVIQVKKQKKNHPLFCEGEMCYYCTLLQTSVCDFEGLIT